MTDATFRIPSRTVQYGYVEIPVPADSTPEMMAAYYISYVFAFQKEEEAAIERIKAGAAADKLIQVDEDAGLYDPRDAVGDPVKALQDGLGASVVEEYDSATEAKEAAQAGSTSEAPWNKTPATTAKKPWEAGNEPAKPSVTLDAGW